MTTSFASSAAPLAIEDVCPHPGPLPRGLRAEAGSMSFNDLHATYALTSGPLRLGQWECFGANRIGPQPRTFRATIAVGDRIATSTVLASGPIGALTEMLHDRGIAVEVCEFHQMPAGGATATFVRGTDGMRERWAMGWAQDATGSALRALIACANRLYVD